MMTVDKSGLSGVLTQYAYVRVSVPDDSYLIIPNL